VIANQSCRSISDDVDRGAKRAREIYPAMLSIETHARGDPLARASSRFPRL
jgi:hypothetical protein